MVKPKPWGNRRPGMVLRQVVAHAVLTELGCLATRADRSAIRPFGMPPGVAPLVSRYATARLAFANARAESHQAKAVLDFRSCPGF